MWNFPKNYKILLTNKKKYMKKILYFTLILLSLTVISCDGGISDLFSVTSNTDEIISSQMKTEQIHLNNYNKIKRMTTDTLVIKFIDSLKKDYVKTVHEVKGMVQSHVGFTHGNLKESLTNINTYIDSLK